MMPCLIGVGVISGFWLLPLFEVAFMSTAKSPNKLIKNLPGLRLIQVIRVKPGTPDSYILNMTYLGAQYVAWIAGLATWGKPAPCYWPAGWTYGGMVYGINITEPIGANWDYYCGPKGVWIPMKP